MKADLSPPRELNEMPLYRRQMGWEPHPAQEEIICAHIRNRVVSAGRRFGKSEIGGHKLAQESLNTRLVKSRLESMSKRREFWIVGPSYTDSEKEFRVMWNSLEAMGLKPYFDKPGSYNNPEVGMLQLSMWGGRFLVMAKSEKHPESLVGEGLSGVILAEAAKLKERTWNKLIRPTLADYGGWSLMTSTPEGKNWFYDAWRRGKDPNRPDWWSFRGPSWLNPYVYPTGATDDGIILLRQALESREMIDGALFRELGIDPEIGEMVADLTKEAFNQEIGAEFTEFVGRVFKGFDEDIHVGDFELDPTWSTYAAVDYGFTNPSVWLLIQVDPHGEQVRVLDEVYESGLTADEFATRIVTAGLNPGNLLNFYPDPASPGDTRVLEKRLRVKAKGGTGGELDDRLDAIRRALKERNTHLPYGHVDRVPGLVIDRRCVHTIQDMLNYRYPERRTQQDLNKSELPMKKDDHGPEALGRFFGGHFGNPDRRRRARSRPSNLAA